MGYSTIFVVKPIPQQQGIVCNVVVVFVFSFINMGFGGRTVAYAKVNGKDTDLDLPENAHCATTIKTVL